MRLVVCVGGTGVASYASKVPASRDLVHLSPVGQGACHAAHGFVEFRFVVVREAQAQEGLRSATAHSIAASPRASLAARTLWSRVNTDGGATMKPLLTPGASRLASEPT